MEIQIQIHNCRLLLHTILLRYICNIQGNKKVKNKK